MKFYESQTLERIGFDFYCDIANNIVKARNNHIAYGPVPKKGE